MAVELLRISFIFVSYVVDFEMTWPDLFHDVSLSYSKKPSIGFIGHLFVRP